MTGRALSVIVPTFNRPDGLIRAVSSLFAQTLSQHGFTIIIVDNTPDASAAAAIETLRKTCPETLSLIALHEPDAGVANARNKAMSAVQTELVAFLDDDQSAPRDWLESLLANHGAFPAAVTFGPVATALPDSQTRHRDYFSNFFARLPGHASGYIQVSYGCGNTLIDFSLIPGDGPWFDTAMNEVGGEDDMLFERVRARRGQFAWAAEASVLEHPPADRIRLRYTLKRAFSYGQGPVTLALLATPPRYLEAFRWMFVGAGKFVWHGPQWLALLLVRHPGRAYQLDKTVRGLAKLVWFYHLRFYGNAAIGRKSPRLRAVLRPGAETAPVDAP